MSLELGEKVHVITRRSFEGDLRRHFVGEVQAVSETTVRLEGYVFVLNAEGNQFVRRPEKRIRVLGFTDSGQIINVIPHIVNLEELSYGMSAENRSILTDGKSFSLDINEFSSNR